MEFLPHADVTYCKIIFEVFKSFFKDPLAAVENKIVRGEWKQEGSEETVAVIQAGSTHGMGRRQWPPCRRSFSQFIFKLEPKGLVQSERKGGVKGEAKVLVKWS